MTIRQVEAGAPSGVQSIDRAATILRCFADTAAELTLSEIARATGLTTSTVHRLLAAMHTNNLVRADPRSPVRARARCSCSWCAGRRGADDPARGGRADDGRAARRGRGDRRPAQLSRPTSGWWWTRWRAISALRRTYTDLGVPIPLPYGAPGKVLCAWLPPARREAVLNRRCRS